MFPFSEDNTNSSLGNDPLDFIDSSGAPIPGGFFPGSPSGNMSVSGLCISDALSSQWTPTNVTIRRSFNSPGDDQLQAMEEDQELSFKKATKDVDTTVEAVPVSKQTDEKDGEGRDEASAMFERLSQTKHMLSPLGVSLQVTCSFV